MAIQPSKVPLDLHPVSYLYSKKPNAGYFEDEDKKSLAIARINYPAILLQQQQEKEAVVHRVFEKVVHANDNVAVVSALTAMFAAGALGGVIGAPADPVGALAVSGLAGAVCFFSVKYSLALLGELIAFAALPLTRIYYKNVVQENSDELFLQAVLSFLTEDLSVGFICPLTNKVIRVPAFLPYDDESDKVQLFELEALVTHIKKHGTHPISKKVIGEESVYSCFFAYRLVEERLEFLIDKTPIDIDKKSKGKLVEFLDRLKKDLDAAYEFEKVRLERLRDKARPNPELSLINRLLGLFRARNEPHAEVDHLIEGEFPSVWHRKRIRLLRADRGPSRLVYYLLKYLHMKDDRTEIRTRRLLDALFLENPDQPADLQRFRDIEDSKTPCFTDLIGFIFEKPKLVYVILDCPIELRNVGDLQEKILTVSKHLVNQSFEASTVNKANGLLANAMLSYEVDILTSGRF